MRIVGYGLRPDALTTLTPLLATYPLVTWRPAPTIAAWSAEAPGSLLAILDLHTVPITTVGPMVEAVLQQAPLTRVLVVSTFLSKVQEQQLLFQLGQQGVAFLFTPDMVTVTGHWRAVLDELTGLAHVGVFHRRFRQLVPPGDRGGLLLQLAQHATSASVKQLAKALYAPDPASVTTLRIKLWQDCARVGLATPEQCLDAIRVLLLKVLLDSAQWSWDAIAQYLQYTNAANLGRSCTTRYGVTLTALRALPIAQVEQAVGRVFWDRAPLVLTANQVDDQSNQTAIRLA